MSWRPRVSTTWARSQVVSSRRASLLREMPGSCHQSDWGTSNALTLRGTSSTQSRRFLMPIDWHQNLTSSRSLCRLACRSQECELGIAVQVCMLMLHNMLGAAREGHGFFMVSTSRFARGEFEVKLLRKGSCQRMGRHGSTHCFASRGREQPRQSKKKRAHTPKESRIPGETACHVGKRRPSQRGLRKSTRTAPSCAERPSQPRGKARFSHGQNAQSRGQGPEVRRATPPGGSFFEICPCRKRRSQLKLLRAEGRTRKCGPQTAGTPPGGGRYYCPPRTSQISQIC